MKSPPFLNYNYNPSTGVQTHDVACLPQWMHVSTDKYSEKYWFCTGEVLLVFIISTLKCSCQTCLANPKLIQLGNFKFGFHLQDWLRKHAADLAAKEAAATTSAGSLARGPGFQTMNLSPCLRCQVVGNPIG